MTEIDEMDKLLEELRVMKGANNSATEEELAETMMEGRLEVKPKYTPKSVVQTPKPINKVIEKKVLKPKQSRIGDDYIIPIKKRYLMDDKFRELLKDNLMLYLFLRVNIIRDKVNYTPIDIHKKYYEKGFLAMSFPEEYLANKLGRSRNFIRKQLQELHDNEIIRKELVYIGHNRRQYIYILGTHQFINGIKSERYYLDDILEE